MQHLGELNAAGMRTILDNGIEYIVKYPKNKKTIDNLLNIITSTSEKQKYLEKLEYNFDDFISELFEQKEG